MNRMALLGWLVAGFSTAVATAAAPSPTPAPTQFAAQFAIATRGTAEAWQIALTPAVYANLVPAAQREDLVVVNAAGDAVPMAPLPPRTATVHAFDAHKPLLRLPPSAPRPTTTATTAAPAPQPAWLLDAGRPIRLQHLQLNLPAALGDVQWQVALAASDDLESWQTLTDRAAITRLTRTTGGVDARTITVPGRVTARYYRVRVVHGNAVDGDVGDLSAEVTGQVVTGGDVTPTSWLDARVEPAADGSGFDVMLPAPLPVLMLQIQLQQAHSAARIVVTTAQPLQRLGTVDVVPSGAAATTTWAVPGAPRYVQRLHLQPAAALATVPVVRVAWRPDRFVFLPQGAGPYRLLAGSYAARRGTYPITAALDRLRATHGAAWRPATATLGPALPLAGAAARSAPAVFDWGRWLLWGVLVCGVLLVGAMVRSLLHRGHVDGGADGT